MKNIPLKKLEKYGIWLVSGFLIFVVSIYWAIIASDRYVSQSNIVLESPQISTPSLNFSALLRGGAGSADMLLLRDYLLSVDMLRYLEENNGFRQHYSNSDIDLFSRLDESDVSIEELHEYFLKRVSVELDEYAQVLRIKVEAFTPEQAFSISSALLKQGERHMNLMGQRLAQEQVRFLEEQVHELAAGFEQARSELIDYQNLKGLVSPTGTVQSLNEVVAALESQLASLNARETALLGFQSPRSPDVVRVKNEIKALQEQINRERARMATDSGESLNKLSSEYQILELKLKFAQESYAGALGALESTRIEAARKLKQVSILQSPTVPEYSQSPDRLYNVSVFAIITLLISFIINMMITIIRDHQD
ncbi:chain-length determining protein [Neptunomonas concharum]|uniref:Chain-length determining protein n=1 Tax=Neptunomonas concharum TaxID=1031538 RepID=A0A5P1R998_9GAMM|nr:chain-length determining protein [Neptunomonas concharum]QEQ95866.1 chain-length determining protein [Neptunomonas concharum]